MDIINVSIPFPISILVQFPCVIHIRITYCCFLAKHIAIYNMVSCMIFYKIYLRYYRRFKEITYIDKNNLLKSDLIIILLVDVHALALSRISYKKVIKIIQWNLCLKLLRQLNTINYMLCFSYDHVALHSIMLSLKNSLKGQNTSKDLAK
jgi:hypothetical protein